jgi:ABC-type branched-subunit amino acid transport system ATPase component
VVSSLIVLEAFDLYRFYHAREEETLALRGVSIHVERSEIVVVMGHLGVASLRYLLVLLDSMNLTAGM